MASSQVIHAVVEGLTRRRRRWRVDCLDRPGPGIDAPALARNFEGVARMSDRSQSTSRTDVIAFPIAPATDAASVAAADLDEIVAIAADLEEVVDGRRERARRVFDVAAATAGLAVLAPVMALVAIGIKLDSRGPIFYAQDRVGINRRRRERRGLRAGDGRRQIVNAGRPFRIYKFRTMRTDAEVGGPQWATSGDPRITRVGRVLRKTRLDEIPQFWNVLQGDMTLIGPRPERPFFVNILQKEVPHYSKRLLVKPGITGMAQVNHKYDDSIESVRIKVKWDLRYIRSQGARSDLRILLRTIRTVLTGEGAC
jgi:lipopolysaccharide/colanic/teichoic acid biosynthesis glycosyltransferase